MVTTRICILSPLKPASGNYTTASRIRQYFPHSENDHLQLLRDPKSFGSETEFKEFLHEKRVHLIIALHAFHCSHLLKDCSLPFIVIFGGTDLNCSNPADLKCMFPVVKKARFLVCFSLKMLNDAVNHWPKLSRENMLVIPQGADVFPSRYPLRSLLHKFLSRTDSCNLHVFTLVAGIRKVKDPLFLIDAFSAWHCWNPDVYLLIIGPMLDEKLGKQMESRIEMCKGVVYWGSLSTEDAHAAIQQSDALVNSSLSEGMSAAILEAMAFGVPVIARDIPGNASVIKHGENGFLYKSPEEFVEQARMLLSSPDLKEDLIKNGLEYIKEHHSCEEERAAYRTSVNSVIDKDTL